MFQVDWAQREKWGAEPSLAAPQSSQLDRATVRRTSLLHWEEHCLECAAPACYASCPLYVSRGDKRCARFVYGIFPNPNFKGLFDFGADIRFRRWAKLETRLYGKSVTVRRHRLLDHINRLATPPLTVLANNNKVNGGLTITGKSLFSKARNKYFTRLAPPGEPVEYDEFVIECFSPESEAFRLILEYVDQEVKARHSFEIKPGWNLHAISAAAFNFKSGTPKGKILLYPENSGERRLVFTWLDLVQYRESLDNKSIRRPAIDALSSNATQQTAVRPAEKVKCVAWDLDNTLWHGILVEDTAACLTPRAEALELVKMLDERGILQTVVSKNNHVEAWRMIEELGLQEYFLYPAINWQPKSSNLEAIAGKLNLNLDSFALIDDSSFERAEIQAMWPQVRVYSEKQIEKLLSHKEFDVPMSAASGKRRKSYLTETIREKERESFTGGYEAFLRSCQMKLRLFVPRETGDVLRCLELIQRANQLNLSNTRYSSEEFERLLSSPGMLCLAMECSDRFGIYGIVGFASVDESRETATLRDLVLSCRVAQKRVEHSFVQWLAVRERAVRSGKLLVEMVRTERNQPIRQVFDDLLFRAVAETNGRVLLALCAEEEIELNDIVAVEPPRTLNVDEGLITVGKP